MQVELIGCTSAGKSTLIQQMLQNGAARDIPIMTSYDFVLWRYALGWVRPRALRMLLLHGLAFWACLRTIGKHRQFLTLILRLLWELPHSIPLTERLKIARITLRNLGIHEIVTRNASDTMLVLADEGTIQAAHYLFVHVTEQPDLQNLAAYLEQAPLPDLLVYYQQPEAILVERTLVRGHKRIRPPSFERVSHFIQHAAAVFTYAANVPLIRSRTLLVDGQEQRILYRPEQQKSESIVAALIQ